MRILLGRLRYAVFAALVLAVAAHVSASPVLVPPPQLGAALHASSPIVPVPSPSDSHSSTLAYTSLHLRADTQPSAIPTTIISTPSSPSSPPSPSSSWSPSSHPVLAAAADQPPRPSETPETDITEHYFKPFEVSAPHIVYVGFGAFVVIFACFSLFIKEKLFLGEAPLAAIFGIIVGPYCLDWFNPSNWGKHTHHAKPPGNSTTDTITLEVLRVTIALAVFAAGVELPKKYMLRHWQSISVLLGPVMLFGWLVTGLFLWGLVPGLDYLTSLVVAAAVTPTDPILSASVVGGPWAEKHVPAHIRHLLICESGCNDGAAFPFLYLALYLTANRHDVGWAIGRWAYQILVYEILLGTIIGALVGWIARKVIRLTEHWRLVDRESFVVHYIALALLSLGINALLGSDDLLAAFAAGASFAWDGWFTRQTEDSNFSAIVDLLFNTATFIYLGAMMPFGAWVDPETTLNIWRLFVIAILTILFKRIPILIALWKYIPDIKTFRDAMFVGHFGPMGCGAIFISTLGRTLLPEEIPSPPTHPNHYLANGMIPITYFLVLCSIAVHGLTVPFFSAARKSTKRIHHTISQGGLGRSTSLGLSRTATWESWANRAFQRIKTTGSGKPSRHQTEEDGKTEDEGGMAEIRRVLASQLKNKPSPSSQEEDNRTDLPETGESSDIHDQGDHDEEEEGTSGSVDPNTSSKETRFAPTPTVDSQTGNVPLGQKSGTPPSINPMQNRTITFARNDTYDDIEDTAADAEQDPGDGDWVMDENDAETRRIRQHAYLTGDSYYAYGTPSQKRQSEDEGAAPSPSGPEQRRPHPSDTEHRGPTSKLKYARRKLVGGAGSAVSRLGAVFLSRRPSDESAREQEHGPIHEMSELGEHDLEQQHEEEKSAKQKEEQSKHKAEAEVDRPSSDPDEEEGDSDWLHYPRVREWVEGRQLVLEYMSSRLAEPQVSVIDLTSDDEESWEAEQKSARELDQPEPSPAWRWVCDHRSELETLIPECNPDDWTPHNARYELIKNQVPSLLAKKRKEMGQEANPGHHHRPTAWLSSHLRSPRSSDQPSDKYAMSHISPLRSQTQDGNGEEDGQSAAYRAQLALAAQSGSDEQGNDDPLGASQSYGWTSSRTHMPPIQSGQGTPEGEGTTADQGTTESQDTAEGQGTTESEDGDLGLQQSGTQSHGEQNQQSTAAQSTDHIDNQGIGTSPSTNTDPQSPSRGKKFRVQHYQSRSPSS